MGRIVAVVVVTLLSCVVSNTLAETPLSPTVNSEAKECNLNTSTFREERKIMRACFNDVVYTHINGSTVNRTYCSKPSDFDKNLTAYYDKVNRQCNITIDSKKFLEFVDYSLRNGTYKEFYTDIECVKKLEPKISQCVKDHFGYFNISAERKHSSWLSKVLSTYNNRTCELATEVKDCTVDVLKVCKPATSQYVASLFEFSLNNCKNTTNTTPNKAGRTGSIPVPLLSIVISLMALII